eukprot:9488881-Pyramimonas_sp.AAC.1
MRSRNSCARLIAPLTDGGRKLLHHFSAPNTTLCSPMGSSPEAPVAVTAYVPRNPVRRFVAP